MISYILCVSSGLCSCKHVCECIRGKKLDNNENGKFQYILSTPIGKTEYGGKVALSGGIFYNISVFPYSKRKGKLHSDNISINQMDSC